MFRNIIKHPLPAVVGAVVGQFLLPIPVVGAYVGAQVGAHIAKIRHNAGEKTLDDITGTGPK